MMTAAMAAAMADVEAMGEGGSDVRQQRQQRQGWKKRQNIGFLDGDSSNATGDSSMRQQRATTTGSRSRQYQQWWQRQRQ